MKLFLFVHGKAIMILQKDMCTSVNTVLKYEMLYYIKDIQAYIYVYIYICKTFIYMHECMYKYICIYICTYTHERIFKIFEDKCDNYITYSMKEYKYIFLTC